jgi:hypothetical protein
VLGVLILLPAAGLAMWIGGAVSKLVDGRVVLWAAMGVGAIATVRIMPMVWPTAHRIAVRRRIYACVIGCACAQVTAAGAHALGMMSGEGSMDLTELAAILASSLAGVCVSIPMLRARLG